jgi:hypothetical protein
VMGGRGWDVLDEGEKRYSREQGIKEIATQQHACRRVPLAQRNAPQVDRFLRQSALFTASMSFM